MPQAKHNKQKEEGRCIITGEYKITNAAGNPNAINTFLCKQKSGDTVSLDFIC